MPVIELSERELAIRVAIDEIIYGGSLTKKCFDGVPPEELALLSEDDGCSAYGDTDVDILTLFEEVRGRGMSASDVFYDLGSGNARLVISVALLTECAASIGIELSKTRHEQAESAMAELGQRGELHVRRPTSFSANAGGGEIELCNASMLERDMADATLVFSYNLPGKAFLYEMKVHLARTLQQRATVLLRGQQLPPTTGGARGFLRDPSSWSVALFVGDGVVDGSMCLLVKRLELVLRTELANRMFNLYAYRLHEAKLHIRLDDHPSDGHESMPTWRELPAAADERTARLLRADPRVRGVLRGWLEQTCSRLETDGSLREPRVLPLLVQAVPLGDTQFERTTLVRPDVDTADEDDMAGWELGDFE